MSKSKPGDGYPLAPVFDQQGCAGHLLRTARGFRGFDRDGKLIGTYQDFAAGVEALLETREDHP